MFCLELAVKITQLYNCEFAFPSQNGILIPFLVRADLISYNLLINSYIKFVTYFVLNQINVN